MLLFIDGFDCYTTSADLATRWTYGTLNISTSTVRFSGTNSGAITNNNGGMIGKVVTAGSVFIVGFAMRWGNAPSNGSPYAICRLYDTTGGASQIEAGINASGILQITRNGTVIATGTTALSAGVWYYIEFQGTISSSVSANACFVNLNGTREVTVASGTSTKNTSNTTANRIDIGLNTTSQTFYIDDFYLCDNTGSTNNAPLGAVRVETTLPSGDGEATSWTPNSGSTHYNRVNQNPPDGDSTYESSNTANQVDSFTMQSLSSTPTAVYGVQVSIYARVDDASAHSIAPFIYFSSTAYEGSGIAISTGGTYAYYTAIYNQNPDGSNWANTDVGNCQFGYELVS